MGLKPIKKAEDIEESEDEAQEMEEDQDFDEEAEIKSVVKSDKPSKSKKETPQEEAEEPVNSFTREEAIDIISGNLNRAYQLLQYLK